MGKLFTNSDSSDDLADVLRLGADAPITENATARTSTGKESDLARMDASQQHGRFRALFGSIVQRRREYFPTQAKGNWVVQCYDSIDAFVARFPNRLECENWITEQEETALNLDRDLRSELDRVLERGFSYGDMEELRYEFPLPDD